MALEDVCMCKEPEGGSGRYEILCLWTLTNHLAVLNDLTASSHQLHQHLGYSSPLWIHSIRSHNFSINTWFFLPGELKKSFLQFLHQGKLTNCRLYSMSDYGIYVSEPFLSATTIWSLRRWFQKLIFCYSSSKIWSKVSSGRIIYVFINLPLSKTSQCPLWWV